MSRRQRKNDFPPVLQRRGGITSNMSDITGVYRHHGGKKPEGTIDSQGHRRKFSGSSDRTKSQTTPATSITGASSQRSKSPRVKANNVSPVSIVTTDPAGGWTYNLNNAIHEIGSIIETAGIESLIRDVDTANDPILPSPTPVSSSRAPHPVYVRCEIPQPWSWAAGHKSTSFCRRLQQPSLSHTGDPQLWSWAVGHKRTSFFGRLQQLYGRDAS
ncbi:hypothetical protein Q7P35_010206 [Cladosporium inversicolor]